MTWPGIIETRPIRDVVLSVGGCIGLYLGDEMSGTVARDLTFTNQGVYTSGYIQGAPTATPGDPIPSTKYNGAGTSYILCKSGFILAALTNSSILAAVRTTGNGGGSGRAIYCERASSGNDIWKLEMGQTSSGNHVRFTQRNDAGTLNQKDSVRLPGDGKPHVVGFTKAGTALVFYFDGTADGVATLGGNDTLTNASPESRIGNDKADVNSRWGDQIGFVALFNRALTAGEVGRISVAALGI